MLKGHVTTAHVSGIPRPGSHTVPTGSSQSGPNTLERKTKIKVSSGSQTTTQDFQTLSGHYDLDPRNSLNRKQVKHYNVQSPTGSLRDRVFGSRNSLNKSPTQNSDLVCHSTIISNPHATLSRERATPSPHSARLSVPVKPQDYHSDHSPYSVGYSQDMHSPYTSALPPNPSSSYAWLRHSPSSASSVASMPVSRMTETESMESIASSASSIQAQIQHARANSLTHARLIMHQRETGSPRLSRSNSIKSTKSEKVYPSMLQRCDDIDIQSVASYPNTSTYSQPTSPTPSTHSSSRFNYNLSSGTSQNMIRSTSSVSPFVGGLLSKIMSKEDEAHGSSLSLVSTSSSLYSSFQHWYNEQQVQHPSQKLEEKQAHENRKLRRELEAAQDKVSTLSSQLNTNAHVVAAFEQSLANMTSRLQALTATAEQKDSELSELRSTIEALRHESVAAAAGLSGISAASPNLVRRHTFNVGKDAALSEQRMSRQLSTDSMSSINSLSSACSTASHTSHASHQSSETKENKKKKKKGWLRSSFGKAFSRSKKNKNGSVSDVEDIRTFQSDSSTPNSPLLNGPHPMNGVGMKVSHSSSAIYNGKDEPELVRDLKKQLRDKDKDLTDIRLEALGSAHRLDQLKEAVQKMRNEMSTLKSDNDRLQRLISTRSLASSQGSLPLRNSTDSLDQRLSTSETSASFADLLLNDSPDREGRRVVISVLLGCHGDYSKYSLNQDQLPPEALIGSMYAGGETKWDLLDNIVRRVFKEYVLRVDPVSNLGLNAESVFSYHVGEITRCKGKFKFDTELPELLPCGYLVGDNMQIRLTLKGTKQNSVDALAFETLIPKSIINRYVSLLVEHRRIILCGPSGTGKTYLAQKLAEYLVLRSGKSLTAGSIATFNVDHKSSKELRQYLSNVAEQCESSNAGDLPTVIILDNLHHVGSLGEVFNGFLNAKYQKCPYIMGTMNQATCSTTNLQLHHNFRWVLCANHMEPVKGFLGRYLRRKLIETEVRSGVRNNDLNKVIDWMPRVWQHLNKFLETHSSSDVTIGPRLFLSCPMDISGSQVWFTDLWNYSIVPYLLEAVREGLQLYGRRAPWEDPTEWVLDSYPWPTTTNDDWPSLLQLRPEDVGYEGHPGPGAKSVHSTQSDAEGDPLLNMLMRLQEAAGYSSPQSNDSDSTSLDSHSSGLHSADDIIGPGLESTL